MPTVLLLITAPFIRIKWFLFLHGPLGMRDYQDSGEQLWQVLPSAHCHPSGQVFTLR